MMSNRLIYLYEQEKIRMYEDGKGAMILGYKVTLTFSEHAILNALVNARSSMSKDELAHQSGTNASSISVHVSNINKKVSPITRRRLIVCQKDGKYKISETM